MQQKLSIKNINTIASRIKSKNTQLEKQDELMKILINERGLGIKEAVKVLDDLVALGIYEV